MECMNEQYMVMDSKIYEPPICQEISDQAEVEEIARTFTLVIVTDKHRIEIEIG